MKMKKLSEYLFMGALGGTLYYMIEIIFRGYSHWSMFFVGRNLFYIFRTTRVMDEVERASLETSPLVYGVCSIC